MEEPVFTDQLGSSMRRRVDAAVWAKSDGRCWYCGTQCQKRPAPAPVIMTIDHIVPQVLGGSHRLDNLVPCCLGCNVKKRKKSVEEFRWLLVRERLGIPYFQANQLAWLAEQGFTFPTCEVSFWFEREGLS